MCAIAGGGLRSGADHPNAGRLERLLTWLRVWGEVDKLTGRPGRPGLESYTFRSWVGRWTPFVLTEDGHLFIPGTQVRAWPDDAE